MMQAPRSPFLLGLLVAGLAPSSALAATGELYVSVQGEPGRVFLDGVDTGLNTPATVAGVEVGSHQVEVRGTCGLASASVDVVEGRIARLDVRYQIVGGFVEIRTRPAEADVSIDGRVVGQGPTLAQELGCGEHVVEASLEGWRPASRTLDVKLGAALQVDLVLEQRASGSLELAVTPEDATLYVDGTFVGVGAREVEGVAAGSHVVRAERVGYEPGEVAVVVGDEAVAVDLRLTPVEDQALVVPDTLVDERQGPGPGRVVRTTLGSLTAAGAVGVAALGAWQYSRATDNYAAEYLPVAQACDPVNANDPCWVDANALYDEVVRAPKLRGLGLFVAAGVGLAGSGVILFAADRTGGVSVGWAARF